MRATNWEFRNRAMIFGLIIGLSFALYSWDYLSAMQVLVNWLGPRISLDPDVLARFIFFAAALLLALAALLRTWSSAYLHATVVYASEVKTATLVADGPYRYVRNPLYLGNIMMAIAMASMMSRSGATVAILLMWLFCLRLIVREEADLEARQGDQYVRYCIAVPRLWPALRPRVPASGKIANWKAGFKAELWYWGLATSLAAFAATLALKYFFVILSASILLFWISSAMLEKKQKNKSKSTSQT
jgi:protein-S-isoprenylcysteine O-methyltransferase Ste14